MKLKLNIQINFHQFNQATVVKLITAEYQTIVLEKFGSHERDQKKFTKNVTQQIDAHWEQYMSILIKGKNKFFLSLDTDGRGKINGGGSGDFSLKNLPSVFEDLSLMMTILNEDDALIYAGINTEDLFEQRHREIDVFESGGRAVGVVGWSVWDFLEFLPGVNCYTFFGKEYVKQVGKDKFLDLEGVNYSKTKNGSIAFSLNKSIKEITLDDQEAVEKQIGESYFFSKKRLKESLSHPEEFKVYLQDLEKEFDRKYR